MFKIHQYTLSKSFKRGAVALLVAVFLYSSPVLATTYECTNKQAFEWQHGVLKSTIGRVKKEVIRFNDETAILWDAPNPSRPFVPLRFEILQKMSSGNDLVAISTNIINGHFTGNETLTIRAWDKEAGLIFLFTSDESVSSGTCKETTARLGE